MRARLAKGKANNPLLNPLFNPLLFLPDFGRTHTKAWGKTKNTNGGEKRQPMGQDSAPRAKSKALALPCAIPSPWVKKRKKKGLW